MPKLPLSPFTGEKGDHHRRPSFASAASRVAPETALPVRRSKTMTVPSSVRMRERPARRSRKFVAGAVRGTAPAVPVACHDGRATGAEALASGFVPAGEEDSRDGWENEMGQRGLCMAVYKHNLQSYASYSFMDEIDSYVSDGAMAKTSLSIKVGAAIRKARKQRGLVMRHIAEHNDTDVAAVGNWETGRNLPKTENLLKTAAFLRVDPVALGKGEVVFLDDADNVADAEIVTDAAPLPAGPMDIELLGAAVGGDDGDFTFNGEVAGYVQRPPGIAHLRKVFALHVLSDSMVPRYEPGEMLYCGGRDAVPGDHVVIEMFPEENERNGKAFIKKLVKRTAAELVVEQYNPPKTLTFNRYAIKAVFRVIPLKELLGY